MLCDAMPLRRDVHTLLAAIAIAAAAPVQSARAQPSLEQELIEADIGK